MSLKKSLSQYLVEAEKIDAASISDKTSQLQIGINNFIDDSIAKLKLKLIEKPPPSGGAMDTLKRWWSNFWYGSKGTKNPYYHSNILGGLGAPSNIPESVEPIQLSLEHYNFLKQQSDLLEANLVSAQTPQQTRLFAIINNWAKDFKISLNNLISGCMTGGSCSASPITISAPASKVIMSEPATSGPTSYPLPCENPRATGMSLDKQIKQLLDDINKEGGKGVDFAKKAKKLIAKKSKHSVISHLCYILKQLKDEKDLVTADPDWISDHLQTIHSLDAEKNESALKFLALKEFKPTAKLNFDKDSTLYERTLTCLEKIRS